MTTVKIRVQRCQADSIARFQLNKAMRGGSPVVVSDPCVVRELLALAQERKITVEFYGVGDKDLVKVPLDLAGVKAVLEGKEL